jgi:hypothetical protein
MQEVRAASFHLHKARIMSASLQLPDHFEVYSECPFQVFAAIGSGFRSSRVNWPTKIEKSLEIPCFEVLGVFY